jgi:protein phosphatase
MLQAHGVSHAGHVRPINEDSWLVAPDLGLCIVADGMGGHNAGEVASKLAVESIHQFMRRTVDGGDVTWPYGIDARVSFTANRLRTAIKLANRRVSRASEAREEYANMGTTVVVVAISDGVVTFASVGDSRLYWFDASGLTQITTDDSWQVQAERAGAAPGGASMRHVLTKSIGAGDNVEFEVHEREVAAGARLLLCSDGLYTETEPEAMASVLADRPGPEAAAEAMVALALGGKARDNVTAVVIDLVG